MSEISITEVLRRLRPRYPDVTFDLVEANGVFRMSALCNDGTWSWMRGNLASTGAALTFAHVAMDEFHGS